MPALLAVALSCSFASLTADVQVQVLQDKLYHPWSVVFLPDNQTLLITERSGQLRSWQLLGKGFSQPISGVPKVWANRQVGLLDVVLAPDFAQSRRVWLSYTTADNCGCAGGVVGYGILSDDNRQLHGDHWPRCVGHRQSETARFVADVPQTGQPHSGIGTQ